MTTHLMLTFTRITRLALVGGACLYIGVYLWIAGTRMNYPFALEWMEGGSLAQVHQIISGKPLYVEPSLEFIPYIYTPLYFYIAAFVTRGVGLGFFPLRIVSVVASLVNILMIFLIVKRETASKYAGFLASGLFAATFELSGGWYDLARVDSLFLMFLLVGIYALKHTTSMKGWGVAGLSIALAFLTKQSTGLIAVPLIGYSLLTDWRRGSVFTAIVVVVSGGSTWFFDYIYGGWYRYYIFTLPGHHPFSVRMAVIFWIKDVFLPLGLALWMVGLHIWEQCFTLPRQWFYGWLMVGMLGASWASRAHEGGYNNVLLPAYAATAIVYGVAWQTIQRWIQLVPAPRRFFFQPLFYFFCIVQFVSLAYNPLNYIPTRQDVNAGRQFFKELTNIAGDIWIPRHNYLAILAGKAGFANDMAITDILRGPATWQRTKLVEEIERTLAAKKFQAIILDYEGSENITATYVKQRPVFADDMVFWPVSGVKTRPEFLYIPQPETP